MPSAQHDAFITRITGLDVAKARSAATGGATVSGARTTVRIDDDGVVNLGGPDEPASPAPVIAVENGKTPRPMQPDCKPVHGKVPGPRNHLLCSVHNHVVDVGDQTIIANSLDDYKKKRPAPAVAEPLSGHAEGDRREASDHGEQHAHHAEEEEGEEKEKEGVGVTFSREFALGEWTRKVWKDQIEVKFKIAINMKFSIGGETVEIGQAGGEVGLAAAKTIWESQAAIGFGGVDIFSEPSVALEAAYEDKKISLATKFTVKVPIGEVEIKFAAVERKEGGHYSIGSISLSLTSHEKKFGSLKIGEAEIKDVSASIAGSAEVEPEYIKIFLDQVGKKVGMAGGEMAATVAGGEAAIAGSMALVSIMVVAGGVADMMQSRSISEVGDNRNIWRDKMMSGVRAAYQGKKEPSDEWMKIGYDAAMQNIEVLLKQVRTENPNLTDEQIIRITAQRAEHGVDDLKKPFGDIAGQAAWDAWLKANPKAMRGVAENSWQAAFSRPLDENDKNWKNWVAKQTFGGMI
jgi:hypothetical protein